MTEEKGCLLIPLLSQGFAFPKGIIKIEFEVRKNLRNIKSRLLYLFYRVEN